jgi:hypothetical protein
MRRYTREDYGDADYVIDGLEFVGTCSACPEQYDVYLGTKQVGYVRLRWGHLYCDYPDVSGEDLYSYEFEEGFKGCFDSEEERLDHLKLIAQAINRKLNSY